MESTIEQRIQRLKGLAEKATPGPWRFSGRDVVYAGDQNTPILRADITPYHPEPSVREFHRRANVELAAAAPDLATLCLDLHTQLRQEREAHADLVEALEGIRAGVGMAAQAGVSNGFTRTIEKIASDALTRPAQAQVGEVMR